MKYRIYYILPVIVTLIILATFVQISEITAVPNPVNSGGLVALRVTIRSLFRTTYAWDVDCPNLPNNGHLTDSTSPNPQWTAPNNLTGLQQLCVITVDVNWGLGNDTKSYNQSINPAPPSLNFITPTDGIVGTLVRVNGSSFSNNHSVRFNNRSVFTTFVNSSELQFHVPQNPAGNYDISVEGAGTQSFSLIEGLPNVSPSPLNILYDTNVVAEISLPLAAPPGGVDLTSEATPSGIIELSNRGRLNFSEGDLTDRVSLVPQCVGSGSFTTSGEGYTTTSTPFSVTFAPPNCGVRARPQGGVLLTDISDPNRIINNIPASEVPGRIQRDPTGARAVLQYLSGIAFVDLVNCSSLGGFHSVGIPPLIFTFSSNGGIFAADWQHTTENDGFMAFNLCDGSFLFNETTTSTSQNLLIKGDSTGTFFFWVTSRNTSQGSKIDLGIFDLSGTRRCFEQNVPSNNFTISMSGGTAMLEFIGIYPSVTWNYEINHCSHN